MKLKTHNQAFTLLEMLLVIAIIAVLAGIVIVAINPGRQLAQARNAQRSSDLRAIHSAVQQYYIDNKSWPTTTLSGTLQEICDENGEPSGNCLDLTDALVPTYISAIPRDPQASVGTNYRIAINQNTNTPELTAPSSTEYSLEPVQLGTTTLSVTSGGSSTGCDVTTTGTVEETTDGEYTIQKYTAGSGTFVVNSGTCEVEVLVVAGGGGGGYGGAANAGGGGAGGLLYDSTYALTAQSYSVAVGAGGAKGNTNPNESGRQGVNSSFDTLVAIGGGGGAGYRPAVGSVYTYINGGSGGGQIQYSGLLLSGGTANGGQGFGGGSISSTGQISGAGGGGAGAVGNPASGAIAGNGGAGTSLYSNLLLAANAGVDVSGIRWIAGGGGGSTHGSGSGGQTPGGLGGGGKGTYVPGALAGTAGTDNTGGGGGAGGEGYTAGAGGSGVVIVKYIAAN